MLYLKFDCRTCEDKKDLCKKVCASLITLSKVEGSNYYDYDFDTSTDTNLDYVVETIRGYNFITCSCMFIIYNFSHVRPFLDDLTDNFISIFEDVHKEFPKNFLYEIYEDDNFKEPKTVTFEFIDLENKD